MCLLGEGWRSCGCVLDLIILPLVCFVGFALNSVCLLVFSLHRSHPLVNALIVLSICDLLQLLLSFFVLIIPALHDFTHAPPFGFLGQIAYLSTGILSPLLLASNSASIWTITYISVQRHQAILRPLSHLYAPPRPFLPLVLITLVALLFNASKWAEYQWRWIKVENTTQWFLMHEPSHLAHNHFYRRILDHLMYPMCVYLMPLILLSVLNFRILSHISIRRVSFDHKSRMSQERRSVTLLISIVTLFFLCHTGNSTPFAGGLAYRFVDQAKYAESELFVLVKDIINLMFNINSFANPMLYFFFTRQFRDLRDSFLKGQFSPTSRSGSLLNGFQLITFAMVERAASK